MKKLPIIIMKPLTEEDLNKEIIIKTENKGMSWISEGIMERYAKKGYEVIVLNETEKEINSFKPC